MNNETYKVGDRVIVDNKYKGTIININNYRPPESKYAIDLDNYKEDCVFVGYNDIQKIKSKQGN